MKHFFYLLVVILISISVTAQSDSAVKQKVKFKLGVYYNSNLNYYGRTDELESSGVFPLGELWFGENFYINAAPVFINNRDVSFQYAGTIAAAGYQFTSGKHFSGHLYITKPIYRADSRLVQSALKAQFSSSFTWINKIVNVTAGGDVKWSQQADFGATASLDHIFRFKGGSKIIFVLDPTITANAGTQRFAHTYYEKSGGFLIFPGAEQEVTTTGSAFNMLSYELSVPVIVARGKMQWLINPAYVIPQHLITIENRPDLSETGKKIFYVTAGMKINF